jgi:hypothetical protein
LGIDQRDTYRNRPGDRTAANLIDADYEASAALSKRTLKLNCWGRF